MTDILSLLRQGLADPSASFRPGQEEAIRAALEPPHRALVVQATGWGKSMVYFIATKVLRDQGRGPTLVVSPLLSLMRDQLRAAERLGLRAARYTSDNAGDWPAIQEQLRQNRVDLLLISPERLANQDFREFIPTCSLATAGLIVVDEAHCISDWGHDFRVDYQRLGELIRNLPPTTSVLATTATANDRVVADVREQIGSHGVTLRGSLARESLRVQVVPKLDAAERLAWLADHLKELPGSGIIYTLTIADCERVARWLQSQGYHVKPYHSQVGAPDQRSALRADFEHQLMHNEVKALVSTVALGMGFDKPDLGFVVHYQSPGNLVAYYQQIGRAGRAIDEAVAVLFLGHEDADIHEWFLEHARPTEDAIREVLDALERGPMSVNQLLSLLNHPRGEIERVLKCLGVMTNSPIVKIGSAYQLTPNRYVPDLEREAALRERRQEERRRFEAFAQTRECFMELVRRELDDPDAAPCGRCSNCLGQDVVSTALNPATVHEALSFLNRSEMIIQPRAQWPAGGLVAYGFAGRIPAALKVEPGLCLARWGDPGAGAMVRHDKPLGTFRDELVGLAANALMRDGPASFDAVCAVPSQRSGNLVGHFSQRLAGALGVPFLDVVRKVRATAPQKHQRNSAHQARNLDGAFEVEGSVLGRMLLVDDMVDSRWTLTVVGALLRQAGAVSVTPFALASTSGEDGDE